MTTTNRIANGAAEALETARPVLAVWARVGLIVRGLLYVMLGGVSALAAWYGTRTVGTGGALVTIHRQPFGIALLVVVVAAFVGLGVWEVMQVVEGPLRQHTKGQGASGWARRAARFFRGVGYFAAALGALQVLLLHRSDPTGDRQARGWTAWLMSYPLGRWLIAAVGLGTIVFGALQIGRAMMGKLASHGALFGAPRPARDWFVAIARFGTGARGVVFLVVGLFLVMAAWYEQPREARGLGGALHVLQRQPYGPWLLGAVALGLMSYGIYQLVLARYGREMSSG